VTDIDKNSPAEKAGILEGDRILRFGGQPVLSWADVQWVLYTCSDAQPLKVEIDRGGKAVEATLVLLPGWRTR
jgi:S1-C subfamily serine protease